MIERQRLAGGLFNNMAALSPQQNGPPSQMELHSDLQSMEGLPTRITRNTPLKSLANMGPMDVFLGSSPTPHARRSSQRIVSDDTNIVTPSAIRTVRLADNEDMGSSPPRFEGANASISKLTPGEVADNHDVHQPDNACTASFDDGTTMDEEALAAAVTLAEEYEQLNNYREPSDYITSDAPSPTIELQLTAQIDADIQTAEATTSADGIASESNNDVSATQDGSGTEAESTPKSHRKRKGKKVDMSNTSHARDSFESTAATNTPGSQDLRRSTRHSMDSPIHIQLSSVKKRKKPRRNKTEHAPEEEASSSFQPLPERAGDELESMVVASPTERTRSARKRKSMSESPTITEHHTAVPESGRKRSIRRSQSNLSQVESAADILEDTLASSKRARQGLTRDVSEAKPSPPPAPKEVHSLQSKRLSHIQITPCHDEPAATAMTDQIAATRATVADIAPVTRQTALVQHQIRSEHQVLTGGASPNRSFAERVILTPRSIINKLRDIKNYFLATPGMAVSVAEEREFDDALFEIRREVHAAGQRGEKQGL